MIASLPMYDWADLRPATDALWRRVRDALACEGVDAPATLDRETGLWETWQDPALVLSQTCGMPYRTRLHGRVTLIGTPDYGLPGAPAGHYYSVLVVRADTPGTFEDFQGAVLVCNGDDSQSGWAAPLTHAAERGMAFGRLLLCGAHRNSAVAVAEGRADIAAVDAVTWRLICAHLPDVAGRLRVVDKTAPTPGLPLIAAPDADAAASFRAVAAAISDLEPDARAALGICGLVAIPAAAYLAVPTPPAPGHIARTA